MAGLALELVWKPATRVLTCSSRPTLGRHQVPAAPAWGAGFLCSCQRAISPPLFRRREGTPQARGDATGSEARGPGVSWAPAGHACRVWPGGGAGSVTACAVLPVAVFSGFKV